MKKFLYLGVMALLLAGCQSTPQNPPPQTMENTQPTTQTTLPTTFESNVFELEKVKVGDTIAGFKIVSIEPVTKADKYSEENVRVRFSGDADIKGRYRHYREGEGILADIVCVDNLDSESEKKLPKLTTDTRNSWFCFRNNDFAKTEFAPPGSEGDTEVKIKEYEYVYLPSEVWNSATLVEVVNKTTSTQQTTQPATQQKTQQTQP